MQTRWLLPEKLLMSSAAIGIQTKNFFVMKKIVDGCWWLRLLLRINGYRSCSPLFLAWNVRNNSKCATCTKTDVLIVAHLKFLSVFFNLSTTFVFGISQQNRKKYIITSFIFYINKLLVFIPGVSLLTLETSKFWSNMQHSKLNSKPMENEWHIWDNQRHFAFLWLH